MAALDPDAIYENFTHKAAGTASLADARQAAARLSEYCAEDAETVRGLALTGLASELSGLAAELNITQDLIGRQIESFEATAGRVGPMPPRPAVQDAAAIALAGGDPVSMLSQWHDYLAAANNNVDAMTSYQNDSAYNTVHLPRDVQ